MDFLTHADLRDKLEGMGLKEEEIEDIMQDL